MQRKAARDCENFHRHGDALVHMAGQSVLSAAPGMVELHSTRRPLGRRKTTTASRRSRDVGVPRRSPASLSAERMKKANCDGADGSDQPRLRQGDPWVCATRGHGDRNLRQGTIQKQVVQIGPPLLGTLRFASKDPVGRHPHADPGARRAPGVEVSGDSWRREAPERSWRQRVAALRACRADARTDKCSGCC
jgi:hypothetical protein